MKDLLEKLKKVKKGMSCCLPLSDEDGNLTCEDDCPYHSVCETDRAIKMPSVFVEDIREAIEKSIEHYDAESVNQPLTWDQIMELDDHTAVWIERGSNISPDAIAKKFEKQVRTAHGELLLKRNIGNGYRVWLKFPWN